MRSRGVFIEGNSFTDFVDPDFFVMMKRSGKEPIKKSAKRALKKTSAFFIYESAAYDESENYSDSELPVYRGSDFGSLICQISSQLSKRS